MRAFLLVALCCLLGTAAAEKADGPLLTIDGATKFVTTSLTLSKDMTTYLAKEGFSAAYTNIVPPDVQSTVESEIAAKLKDLDVLRKQNKIPTFAEMYQQATKFWEQKAKPQMLMAYAGARSVLFPVEQLLMALVAQFESRYPSSKGLYPRDIFDMFFVMCFLSYLVYKFVMPVMCVFCCCCKRRASAEQRALPSINKMPTPSPGKKRGKK